MIPIAKPIIGEKEKELVAEVLNTGMLAQGPKVKEFEQRFAELCGIKHAVAVNSGTAALHSCVYAAGIRPGDEVITVPFTFVATVNPIIMQGAKPVFVDVREDTFNIDSDSVLDKITPKTKAIIAVDLYGQVYDYPAIKEIADDHKLMLIEDAAQAVNALLGDKKAGNFGDLASFSFYATKNMITGEGGIVATENDEYAELAKRFRHHGQSEKTRYEYYNLGYNYRMMDLQAAIGLGQLDKIREYTERRIEIAEELNTGLKDIEGIKIPFVKPNAKHVYHQYTIKVDGFKLSRQDLAGYLKKNGIGCGIYYPKPLHLHPHFRKFGYKKGDFPVAERLSKQVISLPVHPSLSAPDVKEIIKVIKNA
ncbi:aminotransferase class V-fold PLP-dependent enzyme [Candidatus Woesearchaeota archaeon]|nr:aminotransferase class V-fold PLP-dependent enzyme [Candidatus Woesearchaeota archaeon]